MNCEKKYMNCAMKASDKEIYPEQMGKTKELYN